MIPISVQAFFWKCKTVLQKWCYLFAEQWGWNSYPNWLSRQTQKTITENFQQFPRIYFIVYEPPGNPDDLRKTLLSVQNQTYPHWDLLLQSTPANRPSIHSLLAANPGLAVNIKFFDSLPDCLAPLNPMTENKAGYFIFLDEGDTFDPLFLNDLAFQIESNSSPDMIYFDEEIASENGQPLRPILKPEWSPDLLISTNFIAHALFHVRLVEDIFPKLLEDGQESPCNILYSAAVLARSIIHIASPIYRRKAWSTPISGLQLCVEAHLRRLGLTGVHTTISPDESIHASWQTQPDLVSIVILSRESLPIIKRCLNSLFKMTQYSNYEVILVDNASKNPDVLAYYRSIEGENYPLRIVEGGQDFNYNRFNNFGARFARGKYLLFLNNDMEIIQPDWLGELVQWASRPEIGIVGSKLIYPNGTIQHAGIILGLSGHASHIFQGKGANCTSIFGSVNWYRDYLAVTGACMMVRRDIFDLLGGFDENYELVFSDIEFCLRAHQAGFRIVYNPFSTLIHHEGKTRGKFIPARDIRLAYDHMWKWVELGDPYFNPNLSHTLNGPVLSFPFEERPIDRLRSILKYMG